MPRRIDISTKQGMSKWARGIARDMEREFAKNPISIPVEPSGGLTTGLPAVSPPGSSGEDVIVDRLSEAEYRALMRAREIESSGQTFFVDDIDATGLEEKIELASGLSSAGFLIRGLRAGGDYTLAVKGKKALEVVHDRQQDRSRRRQRSRWDLLRWIDDTTEPNLGTRVSLEKFDGSADFLPYTPQEVAAAASYLAEANLIKSIGSLGAPHNLVWITEAGREYRDNPTPSTPPPAAASPFVKPVESTSHNYYGTVVNAGDHAQVAVGDHNSQHQEHNVVEQVSPGYEQLVAHNLEVPQGTFYYFTLHDLPIAVYLFRGLAWIKGNLIK